VADVAGLDHVGDGADGVLDGDGGIEAPPTFDPTTSDRTIRLGLSDSAELWLLPPLLRALEREAPRMRVVAIPVQFRTVAAAFAAGLDVAVTVADELPATIRRRRL